MAGGVGPVLPPNLVPHVTFVCLSRPRRCERIVTQVCTSCGWSSPPTDDEPDDGGADQLSLFSPGEDATTHTAFACRRRQEDPAAVAAQTAARLRDAGLPFE